MADNSDEEEPLENDDGHLSEFTYTNLAELAMRNINVSSGVPAQTSSGLPRRRVQSNTICLNLSNTK